MTNKLKKEDVPFFVEAMDAMHGLSGQSAAAPVVLEGGDRVNGDMSIPEPVSADVQGTMSEEDYQKCSTIMAVCKNMVQQTISNAAIDAGVNIGEALTNMEAWVTGFTTFPFPFFTFSDKQDDTYSKKDFNLNADPQVVEEIVNIKNVGGLKDAVVGALRASEGDIASYSKQKRDFNFFGVITAYNAQDIATRVIKFQLHMEQTDAKALCITYRNTDIDSAYDTYNFKGDKYMMIKMQEAINEKLVDQIAEKLLEFIDDFYQQQLDDWSDKIKGIIAA